MLKIPLNSDWLEYRVKYSPDKTAIISEKQCLTYFELNLLVEKILSKLKIYDFAPRDRVAVLPTHSSLFVATIFALWKMRLVPVLLNDKWSLIERKSAIKLTGSKVLILFKNNSTIIKNLSATTFGENLKFNNSLLKNAAVIIFTSGTTSKPKGVVISFRNLYYNAILTKRAIGVSSKDSWLASLPLFHIGGFAIITRSLLLNNVLILTQLNKTTDLLAVINKYNPNYLSLVPTQLKALIDKGLSARKFLKGILLGGSAASSDLIKSALAKELRIIKVYGSTETTSFIAAIKSTDNNFNPDASGKPIPPVKIKINKGRIIINSPTVANGYFNLPKETKKFFKSEEFYSTDAGEIKRDGLLYVLGRKDGIIISGGENINPREVENALLSLNFIKDAFVFPLKDSYWGTMVACALVTQKRDSQLIKRELKKRISGFKIPKKIFFMKTLPRNQMGKVKIKEIMLKIENSNKPIKSKGGTMEKIIVYQKPTCTTSRKALKYLTEKGIEFEKVNYYEKKFSKNKLKTLLKKMGLKAEDILRKREKAYKKLDLKNNKYTQAQLIEFMVNNPDLIERPIVEKGDKAVLARPIEKIDELL